MSASTDRTARDALYNNPTTRPRLDPSLYNLADDEKEFFATLTGIKDDEELKRHILQVQAKAYEVHGYPCIRSFAFTKLKIARLPGYKVALKLLEQRKNPILLDIGCCFGNDIRKAVLDGWPVENAIASDLRQAFWEYGHELFKSTPQTFPVAFIPGNIFDSSLIAPRRPFLNSDEIEAISSTETPPLDTLNSLTPLQGKISAIHASALFHLFEEPKQLIIAQRLASLLSPESGSIIFGQHGAHPVKGSVPLYIADPQGGTGVVRYDNLNMFCHSPESWREMWIKDVFGEDERGEERVRVDVDLVEVVRKDMKDSGLMGTEVRISVINCSHGKTLRVCIFHLFDEELQSTLASLLSKEAGSVIFGQHAAQLVKATMPMYIADPKGGARMVQSEKLDMSCHSPESWKQLWIDDVFGGGDGKGYERIKVVAELVEVVRKDLKDSRNLKSEARVWMLNCCNTGL